MAGRFIVFEGPDGSGKSSILEEAAKHLEVKGIAATCVQDPGGTDIGAQIREILLDTDNEAMSPLTELLLYVASRAQLVDEVIRPALERGEVVLSDRFTISTLVYQGISSVLPEEELKRVVNLGVGGLQPDHIILLDVPADVGLRRIGRRHDRMEQKGLLFLEEVRQRYLGYADALPPERITVIDANNVLLEVKKEVLETLDELLT